VLHDALMGNRFEVEIEVDEVAAFDRAKRLVGR
jgi:hypothetical protein